MTTTMTTNLKAETLMNLPVLAARDEAQPPARTAASAREFRIRWLVPTVAVLAAIIAYQTLSSLAELNRSLDALTLFMQTPQF